ncbi:uncharacterized protein VP01_139g6 [Puccinia sorghi]|uniref:Uncharacterized protein n=1 Tax=Puccinia sorghi TaxID=27349 RepID=A0A0L6VMW1_9BASI|nr:uncharacterized protein VP01_139g6 [Puccinia sorghi]
MAYNWLLPCAQLRGPKPGDNDGEGHGIPILGSCLNQLVQTLRSSFTFPVPPVFFISITAMQIQALMFFVLSATVLSRSVAPYPRSLNARAAMGIMSHSPRLASRSIVRRAGANTPGDPPEVPNAEDPSANNDPKAQGDDKSKPDDGNKADALKSEDDKKQADAKKTEDDKKNNDPSKPDSTENDAAKGDQNDPNQVADNDPSKKHDGDQDGKGIKRNAKGLIPDTKEGIEFKIATEKKKLHELSEKTKEKDARIAELEQRASYYQISLNSTVAGIPRILRRKLMVGTPMMRTAKDPITVQPRLPLARRRTRLLGDRRRKIASRRTPHIKRLPATIPTMTARSTPAKTRRTPLNRKSALLTLPPASRMAFLILRVISPHLPLLHCQRALKQSHLQHLPPHKFSSQVLLQPYPLLASKRLITLVPPSRGLSTSP